MKPRVIGRMVLLVGAVAIAALSLGCDEVGGVGGISSGFPYAPGPTTPLGVGTRWGGGPTY